MNEIIIKLHLGICSNCKSGISKQKDIKYVKPNWVMCYRLPVQAEINQIDIEIGKHIDLCQSCIAQKFETYEP